MTTGHYNPGYGNIVSDFRRIKSACYPGSLPAGEMLRDMQYIPADRNSLEAIRRQAREVWSRPESQPTSYQDHFHNKTGEVDYYTEARPTSPTRRNRPHPPLVFLNCRLHTVPGFFNPDATLGKDTYRVDGATSHQEQYGRSQIRAKFTARPTSTALHQYTPQDDDQSKERFAKEAFRKINGGRDSVQLQDIVDTDFDDMGLPDSRGYLYDPDTKVTPSLHRYLKPAGCQEMANLNRSRVGSAYSRMRPRTTIGTMRLGDIERMNSARPKHQTPTRRGDYTIHPEWKPHFEHHKLSGLSSVEIPYTFGRR